MAGLLWFVITTTDAVQRTTTNWLTTRDIWWLVSAELMCRPNMTKTCLSWRHVSDMSLTLPTNLSTYTRFLTSWISMDVFSCGGHVNTYEHVVPRCSYMFAPHQGWYHQPAPACHTCVRKTYTNCDIFHCSKLSWCSMYVLNIHCHCNFNRQW